MGTHTRTHMGCVYIIVSNFPIKGVLRTQEEKLPPKVRFRVFSCGLFKGKMTSHHQLRNAQKIEKCGIPLTCWRLGHGAALNVWDVLLESREEVDPSAAGREQVGDVRAERRVGPGAE